MAKKAKKKAAKKAVKKSATGGKKKAAPKKKVVAKKAAKKPVKKAAKKSSAKPAPQNSINPYVNFPGTCEEAFNFYKSVFGGNFVMLSRFKEMPPMEGQPPIPTEVGEKLMHVSLPIGNTILMGSDALEGFGPPTNFGNNFSVSINAKSQNEADRLYAGLSAGGQQSMPMEKTFWGAYFGMLTDKFGINWLVNFG